MSNQTKASIKLGSFYIDTVTGFSGAATGHVTYITGCNQVLLQPDVDKDGNFRESRWLDEQRLGLLTREAIVLDNGETPGPDRPAPKI